MFQVFVKRLRFCLDHDLFAANHAERSYLEVFSQGPEKENKAKTRVGRKKIRMEF